MKWSHLFPWDGKRWDHSHQKYGNVLLKLTKKDTALKISPLSSVLVAGRCGNGGNEHTTLDEIVSEVAHNDHISSIRKSPKKSKTQSLYCVTRSTGGPTESLLIFGIHQDISTSSHSDHRKWLATGAYQSPNREQYFTETSTKWLPVQEE